VQYLREVIAEKRADMVYYQLPAIVRGGVAQNSFLKNWC